MGCSFFSESAGAVYVFENSLSGHSEPRKRAKNLVTFPKKAKPLKECFKILRQSACAFSRIRMTQKGMCSEYKQPPPALAVKNKNPLFVYV